MIHDLTDEEWRRLIETAPDPFRPRIKRERSAVTLPRLRFTEKPGGKNDARNLDL